MRSRVLALVLVGLGAFALVAALAVRLFLVDSVVKLPLDQESTPTAVAADMDWYAIGDGVQHRGGVGAINQTVLGDPGSPSADGDTAVWSIGTVIKADDGTLVDATEIRACVDRRDAAADPECESAAGAEGAAAPEALTVTFPFHTERTDYEVYNSTAAAAFPAEYVGEEELQGLTVYRFEQTVPETVTQTTEVPGPMAGEPAGTTVQAEVVYTNQLTWWVEPTSGVVIKSQQQPDTFIRAEDGSRGVTMFRADVVADEETVQTQTELANDTRSQIALVERTLPLVLLVVGVLALAAGAVLLLRGSRSEGVHRAGNAEESSTSVLAGH